MLALLRERPRGANRQFGTGPQANLHRCRRSLAQLRPLARPTEGSAGTCARCVPGGAPVLGRDDKFVGNDMTQHRTTGHAARWSLSLLASTMLTGVAAPALAQ